VTSHLRRLYGPLAGLARKVDLRKHSMCMSATNQKTQLQDSAEGLSCLGMEEDECTTLERFRDSMDDKAIFGEDTSNMQDRIGLMFSM